MSIDALMLRATAYLALGRHAEAINDLDLVFEINPNNATAYARRALAYTKLGQDAHVREDTDRAVDLGVASAAMDRALEEIKQSR